MSGQSIAIINGSRFHEGTFTGMLNLYEVMASMGIDVNWYQCVDPIDKRDHHSPGKTVLGRHFPGRSLEMGLNRLFFFPKRLRNLKEDIILLSDPTLLRVIDGLKKPVIVKITDTRPLTEFSDNILTKMMFKYQFSRINNADFILVTTKYMKKEMSKYYGSPERIFVIPELVSMVDNSEDMILNRMKNMNQTGKVNILFVGQDRPYKNIQFYVELASHFQKEPYNDKYKFIVVSNLKRYTRDYISRLGLTNLEIHSSVKDINIIYEKADLLVYPSKYEGFGMPVLECMNRGIPALVPRIDPFLEIAGNAGIYCYSYRTIEWAKKIIELIDNPVEYKDAAYLSVKRSMEYSTEALKQAMVDLLEMVEMRSGK